MIYMGIDPGLNGAIAVINRDGSVLEVNDMPVQEIASDGKKKRRIDIRSLSVLFQNILLRYPGAIISAGMEQVHAFPDRKNKDGTMTRGQGVTSAFAFGRGYGNLEQALVDFQIGFTEISPVRWKKAMLGDMPKGKGAALYRARQLFPSADLRLAKHEGRAEALLIAEFQRRTNPTTYMKEEENAPSLF